MYKQERLNIKTKDNIKHVKGIRKTINSLIKQAWMVGVAPRATPLHAAP